MERTTRLELATLHLGKVALYQMSYVRISCIRFAWCVDYYTTAFPVCQHLFPNFLNGFEHPPNRVSHFELDML